MEIVVVMFTLLLKGCKMDINLMKWLKRGTVLSVLVLMVFAMSSGSAANVKVKVLSPTELEAFGGIATCIGNCTGDTRRTDDECDRNEDNTNCNDFTTSVDCCFMINHRWNVHECFGSGGADCWSYGETNCYTWKACGWDGEDCDVGSGSCHFEKEDEQQCI